MKLPLLIALATATLSPAQTLPVPALPPADAAVLALFEQRCAQCHKGDEEPELHQGINLLSLRANTKAVVPGDLAKSALHARVIAADDDPDHDRMPKSTRNKPLPRLTADEVKIIADWISGPAVAEARAFVTDDAVNGLIAADLAKLDGETQRHARYLTLTNLANQLQADGKPRFARPQLALFRGAVDKLLNSLSWLPGLSRATPVDPAETILRLDLRAYGWEPAFWERITAFYPYAILTGRKPETDAMRLTHSALPRLRADWFVFALAQPPLYHEALGLQHLIGKKDGAFTPEAERLDGGDTALEKMLGVNLRNNLRGARVVRSGFEKSGVSVGNRMIERHAQRDGETFGYWKSYDFKKTRKDEPGGDIFTAPLGPVGSGLTARKELEFLHDGGEIVFTLPNGLHGYLLVNAAGRMLDVAPIDIVRDSKRDDGIIINGVSCMACHTRGLFPPPPDEVARVATEKVLEGNDAKWVAALYRSGKLVQAANSDMARFTKAAEAIGVDATSQEEPVKALYDNFNGNVTAAQLASEFGQSSAYFLEDLQRSPEERVRLLASKLANGVHLPRQSFIANFELITSALELGTLRTFNPPPFAEFGPVKAGKPDGRPVVVAKKNAPSPLPSGQAQAIFLAFDDREKITFLPIPLGKMPFKMGSPANERDREENEEQVDVTLTNPYWMAETELTHVQWKSVMGTASSQKTEKVNGTYIMVDEGLPKEMDNCPRFVSYVEAVAFCKKLNTDFVQRLPKGLKVDLPTEAQWEYACRADTTTAFHYGNSLYGTMANISLIYPDAPIVGNTNSEDQIKNDVERDGPVDVKTFKPNVFGLFDMHGNVMEWCKDKWDGRAKLPGGRDPEGASGDYRVIRGGGWEEEDQDSRSAKRFKGPPNVIGLAGFRPVLVETNPRH